MVVSFALVPVITRSGSAADMIVMGSHGHSALSELLSGSVAHAVTVHAEVPVLLVPINH